MRLLGRGSGDAWERTDETIVPGTCCEGGGRPTGGPKERDKSGREVTAIGARLHPYADLLQTNRRLSRNDMECELLDTGVFDEDRIRG